MPDGAASILVNVEIGESLGDIHSTLINGNFEDGLTGWVLSGAGDVVDSFGPILPYEGSYMAMISSGNGAVGEASSALEQSFTVPEGANKLTIHYNFISEEYPEFVGSEFNDVMRATLHTPDGSREIAFEEVNSAIFEPVSGIPCGSGDCTWGQTSWLEKSIDVYQWAGKDDTLTLTVHDVGDTVYDTVVLLDDISFDGGDSDIIILTSEQIRSDSVSLNEWKYYKITTNSLDKRISFDLTHLSDDVDMYIRKGAKPTLNDYDCRPFKQNKCSETCTSMNSESNTWYVGVYGNKAGSFKIKALIGEIKGWSSETGFREADSDLRESIVEAASNADEELSGQSRICERTDACWLTDTAGGDGEKMREAIQIYHVWSTGTQYINYTDTQIRDVMIIAFAGSNYPVAQQESLVDRIIEEYDGSVPFDDDETLIYLGIQKQCLEWAMTIAIEAGGASRNYGNPGPLVDRADVRSGMGYYRLNFHAMIIIDVYHDSEGNPTGLKVAESNWGVGWNNPSGQVPWLRNIGTRDNESFGHTIVNYDK